MLISQTGHLLYLCHGPSPGYSYKAILLVIRWVHNYLLWAFFQRWHWRLPWALKWWSWTLKVNTDCNKQSKTVSFLFKLEWTYTFTYMHVFVAARGNRNTPHASTHIQRHRNLCTFFLSFSSTGFKASKTSSGWTAPVMIRHKFSGR